MADTSRTMEAVLAFRDQLTDGLKKAESSFAAFGKKAGQAINELPKHIFSLKTAIAGLVGALAVREIEQFVERVGKYGDSLNKLNQKTGLTVEFLSKLKYAGEQSGLGLEEAAKGILNFQKLLFDFRRGGDEAVETFSMLGAEFLDAARGATTAEDAMPALIEAFSNLTNSEERVVVASKLFNKAGKEWLPLLSEGGKGFRELSAEAERLGLVLTKAQATAGTDFVDAIERLKKSLFGLGVQAITPLLPTFTEFLDRMTKLVVDNQPKILTFFADLLEAAEGALPKIQKWFEGIGESLKGILGPLLTLREEWVKIQLGAAEARLKDVLTPGSATNWKDSRTGTLEEIKAARKARDDLVREYDALLAVRAAIESGRVPVGQGGSGLLGQTVRALRERAAQIQAGRRIGPPAIENVDTGGRIGPPSIDEAHAAQVQWAHVPNALDATAEALEKLRLRWEDSFSQFRDSVLAVGNALEDNLSSSLADVITGTKNLKEASKELAKSMLNDLAKIIARLLVMRALGGISSLFKSSTIGPPAIDEFGQQVPKRAIGTPSTHGPTIAGEAGDEAIIPLPGNRRVPVQLLGGGGGVVIVNNYNVTALDVKSFDEKLKAGVQRNGDFVAQVAARGFQNRPDVRRRYS